MAKGDDARARNQINYQGQLAQNNLNNLRTRTVDQDRPIFHDNYMNSVTRQTGDYNNLMGGYNEFARTGGFSPTDIANIRSRAIAPSRAIYENAMRNISRNRSLQGGYSPGYQAAQSRLQRDTGQAISDNAINAEAAIAELRQRGQLAGLQGGSNLYGTTPGLINTFGNQLQRNTDQQIDIENLQGRLGLGLINSQIQAGQLPGKWEHTFGRLRDVFDLGSDILFPQGGAVRTSGQNLGTGGRMSPTEQFNYDWQI